MSISFYGYVREGDTWTFSVEFKKRMHADIAPEGMSYVEWLNSDVDAVPNPDYDPRIDVNLSNVNAREILGILGQYMHGAPLPIEQFINLVAIARRSYFNRTSPALQGSVYRDGSGVAFIDCGRDEGYVERVLARLSSLSQASKDYGATHIGWS